MSGSSQRKAISCTQESFDISSICTQEKSHTSAAHAPPQDVPRTKTFTAHHVKMSWCFPCAHDCNTGQPSDPLRRDDQKVVGER